MGREIFAQIRDIDHYDEEVEDFNDKNPHVAWDSSDKPLGLFVCGRDDATGYVAARAEDSFLLLEGSSLERALEAIKGFSRRDHNEISKVRRRLKSLEAARKNSRNYQEFASFDEEIENCRSWLEEESSSSADILLDIIKETLKEYGSGKYDRSKWKPYLVVSE